MIKERRDVVGICAKVKYLVMGCIYKLRLRSIRRRLRVNKILNMNKVPCDISHLDLSTTQIRRLPELSISDNLDLRHVSQINRIALPEDLRGLLLKSKPEV